MSLYGHRDLRILDTARGTWQREGYPWTAERSTPRPSGYVLGEPDRALRAELTDVQAAIDDASRTLLDVRSPLEHEGERFWPSGGQEEGGRAGHVPGAVLVPLGGHLDGDGSFRSRDELAEMFSVLDGTSGEVLTYCTIGARAASAWFVLTHLLGREAVRVYDGSWAEWGRHPSTPVETAS